MRESSQAWVAPANFLLYFGPIDAKLTVLKLNFDQLHLNLFILFSPHGNFGFINFLCVLRAHCRH